MTDIRQIGWPLLAAAALIGACAGSEDTRQQKDELGATAGDSAALAADERRVTSVMIGKRVGPMNRIIEPTTEFGPRDTVHLSVATAGTGGAVRLTTAWRFQTGEIVQQGEEAALAGGQNTAFRLSRPKGLKAGTYKVVTFLGQDSVDTKVFVVK
jgi:hypothetical protein